MPRQWREGLLIKEGDREDPVIIGLHYLML